VCGPSDGGVDVPDTGVPSDASASAEAGAGACPAGEDDPTPKVKFWNYLEGAPSRAVDVTIWLRSDALPDVAPCAGLPDRDARCAQRDVSLIQRQKANAAQLDCLMSSIQAFRPAPYAVLYEPPYHLSDGSPVPVLVAFGIKLDLPCVQRAATSRLVAKIEPSPGTAFATGTIPPMPEVCAPANESPATVEEKVAGLSDVEGHARQPVIIELRTEGLLPARAPCDEGGIQCPAAVASLWERTMLGKAQATCVKRRIDQLTSGSSRPVSYGTAESFLEAPPLPPFQEPLGTTKAFGWGLTYDEAKKLAEDPNVERIWTQPGLQFEPETPGCPPDLTREIPMTVCPTSDEAPDGKISPATEEALVKAAGAPLEVIIAVKGGPKFCPLDACSSSPCATRDAILQRWTDEAAESQRCVRARIRELGGLSSPEVFSVGNAFAATLTASQAHALAVHPHVNSIDANILSPPP